MAAQLLVVGSAEEMGDRRDETAGKARCAVRVYGARR